MPPHPSTRDTQIPSRVPTFPDAGTLVHRPLRPADHEAFADGSAVREAVVNRIIRSVNPGHADDLPETQGHRTSAVPVVNARLRAVDWFAFAGGQATRAAVLESLLSEQRRNE